MSCNRFLIKTNALEHFILQRQFHVNYLEITYKHLSTKGHWYPPLHVPYSRTNACPLQNYYQHIKLTERWCGYISSGSTCLPFACQAHWVGTSEKRQLIRIIKISSAPRLLALPIDAVTGALVWGSRLEFFSQPFRQVCCGRTCTLYKFQG